MSHEPSPLRVALIGAVTLALAMGVGRFAFTPILPVMRDDGLLTVSQGGLLASAHFLGYLMGAVSAAWLTVSPRGLMRFSLVAIAATTFCMGFDVGEGGWLALRWLAGLCSAWVLVLTGNYYVQHLAAHRHDTRQAWVFAGVGAGIAAVGLGALLLTVSGAGSMTTWRVFGALSAATAAVLCWTMGREIPVRHNRRAPAAVRQPLDWTVISAYGAAGLGYIIPATYLPVMARETVASPWIFGAVWPVFGAAAFASTPLAARLQHHLSNRAVWSSSQFVMAAGLVLPAVVPNIVAIAFAGLCVGGTFMVITMAGIREAHRIAPDAPMTHVAALTAAFALGQMIGPGLAGVLYDITGDFDSALWLTSVVLAATGGLLIFRPVRSAATGT